MICEKCKYSFLRYNFCYIQRYGIEYNFFFCPFLISQKYYLEDLSKILTCEDYNKLFKFDRIKIKSDFSFLQNKNLFLKKDCVYFIENLLYENIEVIE